MIQIATHISRVCVYSNSRNDVSRMAQRYGTIAAHTRHRAAVLVVFIVFCVQMHSFAGLIRRTPPPTFSDTAITDRHSDTTIFQLRAHWVQISWSIGSEKSFGHVPPVGVEPSTSCVQGVHPIHRARLFAHTSLKISVYLYIKAWDCFSLISRNLFPRNATKLKLWQKQTKAVKALSLTNHGP